MIMDRLNEFAVAEDVSAAVGTALTANQIDLGIAGRDPGNGQPIYLHIQVTTAFTTATTAAVQFILASDAAAAIATDGTATEHLITDAFDTGVLVLGYRLQFALPVGGDLAYERYLGLLVVTSGATTTAGSISSFLTLDPSYWKSFPDGTN